MGRRKQFNASQPIQMGTAAAADGNPFVIELGAGVDGKRLLSFEKWCARGVDPWIQVIVQQLQVFLRAETFSRRTVITYAHAAMSFLEFLVSTRATYGPSEISRDRIEQFINWLKLDSRMQRASTQRDTYYSARAVLKGLARRGIVPRAKDLFPTFPFPGCSRDYRSEEPLSQAERSRLAEALRADVIALHHRPDGFNDSCALVIYALALCLRTGLNTTPMLELRRDALTRHPFLPKMGLLTSFKRRNHRRHWMTLAGESIRETAAVPVDAVALFNKLLERTGPLAEFAPEAMRNVLWLYRAASTYKRGQIKRLGTHVLALGIQTFVRRHDLRADDGKPLRLNNRRLRVTLENRLWKLSNGDLFTVASLMGHGPKIADHHYLAVTAEMRAHATIVGEALPDIYRGESVEDSPRIERTPVGGCKDSLYGENAPKDGINHCMDFLSCFGCRSYAVVGSEKDLHRLFSFYWFLAAEKTRIASRAWREHFAHLMSLIDAFTLDKFDNKLVKRAKSRAKAKPLRFWSNYQMHYGEAMPDAD